MSGGGGGGKGGQSTSTQSIDPRLTEASVDALNFAKAGAAIPFSPNRGVQFAAFTPQQVAAMTGADMGAGAFGLPTAQGGVMSAMPKTEVAANGIKGYSTGANYDEMKNKSVSQGLQSAIAQLFADPVTGAFNGPGGPLMGASSKSSSSSLSKGKKTTLDHYFSKNKGR